MRVLMAVVIAVWAMGCGGAMEPAAPDAAVDAIDEGTINVPIGAVCSTAPTPWCGEGHAWCRNGVCRQFCAPPYLPPQCPAGFRAQHAAPGESLSCVCVPD